MTDERGTVISNGNDNRNRSGDYRNDVRKEERIIGGGATLPTTLVSSLLLTFSTLLITINPT